MTKIWTKFDHQVSELVALIWKYLFCRRGGKIKTIIITTTTTTTTTIIIIVIIIIIIVIIIIPPPGGGGAYRHS